MATYQARSFQLYDASGNPQFLPNDSDRVLDDGDGAGIGDFELLEAVSEVGGTNLSFQGVTTITVDGAPVTVPVFSLAVLGPDTFIIYSPGEAADSVFPTTYPGAGFEAEAFTTCFSAGTAIDTPNGRRAVETLAIGDLVTTADGASAPVKWIGRQTVFTMFRTPERVQPVRVRAGALGGSLPERDLILTADHALLIDGLLVNAGALVNGTTIDHVPVAEMGARYTVYHIETEDHDVILAEGAAAETFIDYAGRQAFDNYDEYVALYGEDRGIVENPVPRVTSARMLPAGLRARLGILQAA